MTKSFTFQEIKHLIESEPEYPSPWPKEMEEEYRRLGITYRTAAVSAVACTKKSLLERLEQLNKED